MISYLKLRLDVWPCDVVVMELNYNKKAAELHRGH